MPDGFCGAGNMAGQAGAVNRVEILRSLLRTSFFRLDTFPSSVMSAKRSLPRRLLRGFLLLLGLLLIIPPLQVGLTHFWNPSWSPMQIQRVLESGTTATRIPPQWMSLSKIPLPLIHYIWASEDQNFFNHHGFDFDALGRAIASSRESGKEVRGSSTITMQCARSVFLWQGRSWPRKILEAYYTLWMELLLGKKRILELYLNHIEFGPGLYGVGAAAESHFGRPLKNLSDSQMIALAAILPNPLEWSPTEPNAMVEQKIRRIKRLSSRAPFPDEELK